MIIFFQKNDGVLVVLAPAIVIVVSILSLVFGVGGNPDYTTVPLLNAWLTLENMLIWPWLNAMLSVLFAIASMLMLNRAIQGFALIGKLTNIPMLLVSLLFFAIPASHNHMFLWIEALLLIRVIFYCMNILDERHMNTSIFNASLIVGIMGSIMPVFFPVLVTVLGLVILIGKMNLRRILLLILGVSLPIYLLSMTAYLVSPEFTLGSLQGIMVNEIPLQFSIHSLVYLSWVLVGLVVALVFSRSNTLREKNKWRFEILLLLGAGGAVFMGSVPTLIATTVVPAIIIVARAMALSKRVFLTRILFYCLLGLDVINLWNL